MVMLKVFIVILIISSTFVDARARRKRRQLSSSSYYISNINPYSTSYNPSVPLTYPSGSYYSAPSYGYPNTGYSADRPYDSSLYGYPNYLNLPTYSVGTNQNAQFQNFGSTYGSGLYPSSVIGYAPSGFSNQYPDWNQGNSNQYYTGGTGTGLSNPGFYWYRSFRNVPPQGGPGGNLAPNPVGSNPPIPFGKMAPGGK